MTNVAKTTVPITQTSAISASELPPVGHEGMRVITTEKLANLYGSEVKHIQNNYLRNAGRFAIGKHYFKLEGAELKEFKDKPSLRGLVASRAKHLILWTERGAARHAKMLETDQAWEVFEQLEDCYFNVKAEVAEQAKKPKQRKSSSDERTPLRQYVEKMIANKSGMKYPAIWKLVHDRFDVQHINQLSTSEAMEALEFLQAIEGEYLGKASTPDFPTSKTLSDDELCTLCWLWSHAINMADYMAQVYPILRAAEHRLAGPFFSMPYESPRVINAAREILLRETTTIEVGTFCDDNWRVLSRMRSAGIMPPLTGRKI